MPYQCDSLKTPAVQFDGFFLTQFAFKLKLHNMYCRQSSLRNATEMQTRTGCDLSYKKTPQSKPNVSHSINVYYTEAYNTILQPLINPFTSAGIFLLIITFKISKR